MPLLPHYCVLCERRFWGTRELCADCAECLPWNTRACSRCALPRPGTSDLALCGECTEKPPRYAQVIAPLIYEAPIDHWIRSLKFANGMREGHVLAGLLAEAVVAQVTQKPDLVLPVPLSLRRLLRRGHNQAIVLAAPAAAALKIPLRRRQLRRKRHTRPQSDLSLKQRRQNIARAFELRSSVAGASVAVVDDVMTTGATINEISALLLDAGARSVQIWTAARTPQARVT